jgi:hypothetical protein
VFPVATHVVDEDWGPDDIDLVLWVSDGRTLPTSGRALASGKG